MDSGTGAQPCLGLGRFDTESGLLNANFSKLKSWQTKSWTCQIMGIAKLRAKNLGIRLV